MHGFGPFFKPSKLQVSKLSGHNNANASQALLYISVHSALSSFGLFLLVLPKGHPKKNLEAFSLNLLELAMKVSAHVSRMPQQ